jgi:uncharacterized iron-regulated protein
MAHRRLCIRRRQDVPPPARLRVVGVLVSLLLVNPPGALPADGQAAPVEIPAPQTMQEGQVVEVRTGRSIPFENWIADLASRDVIYLGEEHRNRSHVEAALKILQALLARGRQPVLGLEMFGWDGQAGLDHYLSDRGTARDRFLQEARWEQNWGGAYDDYEPLINLARDRHIPVLALNPPRALVRQVASQGLALALADPEMTRWGMRDEPRSDEPAYHETILKQLRLCHAGLSDDAYQRMFEASVFRDEGMAKTITEYLGRAQDQTGAQAGPIVSYTGGGHIQYQLPVPNRVLRKRAVPVSQATIYLTAYESGRAEEIRGLIRDSIADYVWLTPLGAHGSPRRCR